MIDPKKKKTISYHEFLNMFEERETEVTILWVGGLGWRLTKNNRSDFLVVTL